MTGPDIPGVHCTELSRPTDDRGWFLKLFQASKIPGDASVGEVYLSSSQRGTIRGLHFQTPPHDHAKTVVCITGAVFDVVVDLRVGSPTEGTPFDFELSAETPQQLYLPAGVAHGFQALTDDAIVAYIVSTEYSPDHDTGIRWDSVGVDWPLPLTAVSQRDKSFPALDEFRSPFKFDYE